MVTPFIAKSGESTEERNSTALEFIAGRLSDIETHLEAMSRDLLKLVTYIQTKMK